MTARLIYGVDVLEGLKQIEDESVQCVVTSPPYWGLRNYNVDGQIGLEKTPEEYVSKMVAVFQEVKRVLRSDGTLWLNLGDSYWGSGGFHCTPETAGLLKNTIAAGAGGITRLGKNNSNLKPKDLCGIPWRVAFALQADGWWLRSDIIWHKPNPMPESVTDRPTKVHEYIFLLTKSSRYFYDAEAIRELNQDSYNGQRGSTEGRIKMQSAMRDKSNKEKMLEYATFGRNKRSVWTIPIGFYAGAHFAVFPCALVEPCINAGTSAEGCCEKCGSPWKRIIKKYGGTGKSWHDHTQDQTCGQGQSKNFSDNYKVETIGWKPQCECNAGKIPCVILDCFSGSGTTGEVAIGLGRRYIGIDLNKRYLELAKQRIGLFAIQEGIAKKEKRDELA